METNSYSFAKPLLFPLPTISLSHKAACSICPSGDGFKLASQSLSAYCDSPLSVHFRGAERMPWLSCMGAFFKSEDIDTLCFLRVFVLLTVMWPFSCLPLFFCLCLAPPPPLCCPGRFHLHSAIQTMSRIMTARKKGHWFLSIHKLLLLD